MSEPDVKRTFIIFRQRNARTWHMHARQANVKHVSRPLDKNARVASSRARVGSAPAKNCTCTMVRHGRGIKTCVANRAAVGQDREQGPFDSPAPLEPVHEVPHLVIRFRGAGMAPSEPRRSFQKVQERCSAGSRFSCTRSVEGAGLVQA